MYCFSSVAFLISFHELTYRKKIWWSMGLPCFRERASAVEFSRPGLYINSIIVAQEFSNPFLLLLSCYSLLQKIFKATLIGFDDSQHFLCVRWPRFFGHSEGLTYVCHWFALLRQDRSNLFSRCIHFKSESIIEVWHANIRVVVMACLRARKAVSPSSCYLNCPFLSRLVRSRARIS